MHQKVNLKNPFGLLSRLGIFVSLYLFSFSNAWTEELSSFEKRELSRLLEMDWAELANQPVSGVLGYDQEHWRNPASIAIIRPDDITRITNTRLSGRAKRKQYLVHDT